MLPEPPKGEAGLQESSCGASVRFLTRCDGKLREPFMCPPEWAGSSACVFSASSGSPSSLTVHLPFTTFSSGSAWLPLSRTTPLPGPHRELLTVKRKVKESQSEVAQSCPTLCDPVDCSPPGSSVHGILQARILEWVAISFSRKSSPVVFENPDSTREKRRGSNVFTE